MLHKQNVKMTCHRKLPIPESKQRDLVKCTRRVRKAASLAAQQLCTVVTAPGSLVSQPTSYCPCLLSCLQQESQCADFPLDSSADCVVKQPLSGYLSSQVPSFLSFLLKRSNNSVHSCCCAASPKEINLLKG